MSRKSKQPFRADEVNPANQLEETSTTFEPRTKRTFSPVKADSFHLSSAENRLAEARAFLEQYELETGRTGYSRPRLKDIGAQLSSGDVIDYTTQELVFGARVAWRNSIRCVGRMFWPSLHIFDRRACQNLYDIFDAILDHIDWSTNGGDLRPAITIFSAGQPDIRIINTQLILYAGYRQTDGTVLGDPKNIALTELAMRLGWRGAGTEFDLLPVILRQGQDEPVYFEIPKDKILEVPITHPEVAAFDQLGLKWFALPAVASMALDMGGQIYSAAPSSGIYQGTEIGSFNLSDPRRYNKLPEAAEALGITKDRSNPLWRDQTLVEINRAVLHSFKVHGVRIMDHHALSESFKKFYDRETFLGRDVHGHWPWIVPPMSANLSWIWHEESFKKVILKPGYFYQPFPEDLHRT